MRRRSPREGSLRGAGARVGGALLLLLLFTPSSLFASEEGSSRAFVRLRSSSDCPTAEELAEVLQPLLPNASIVVEGGEVPEGNERTHVVAWDERGLFYDGELLKTRRSLGCRRLAEDWAVSLALLVDARPEPVLAVTAPPTVAKKPASGSVESRSRSELFVGLSAGATLPLSPSATARAVGALDVSLLFGSWGVLLELGTSTSSAVPLELASAATSAASAEHSQSWLGLKMLTERAGAGVLWSASLGPLLVLDRVEATGLSSSAASSRVNCGLDLGLGARVRLGSTWSLGLPLGVAIFPSDSVLIARNTTAGAEVRLGTLPQLFPRVGLGVYASF